MKNFKLKFIKLFENFINEGHADHSEEDWDKILIIRKEVDDRKKLSQDELYDLMESCQEDQDGEEFENILVEIIKRFNPNITKMGLSRVTRVSQEHKEKFYKESKAHSSEFFQKAVTMLAELIYFTIQFNEPSHNFDFIVANPPYKVPSR